MTLDETLKSIPKGLYQNKKTGNVYEVLGIGEHSEDASLFVIYRRYPNISKRIWCRPVEMWYEKFDKLRIIKASELTEDGGLDYLRRCYKKDQDSYTELSEYGVKEYGDRP